MPRSPSRDRSDRFEGNRGYFHRRDWLRHGRFVLAAVALVPVVVWAMADVAGPARVTYSHTHGPLASPHAAWDHDCAACHRSYSVSDIGVTSVFRARDRWQDMTCEKCHWGPPHNANVAEADRGFHDQCSNCHHDHGGRTNSLVRIADSHCTRCHANLTDHRTPGAPKCAATVTGFTTDHPEFRPLTTPPDRTLKFSHAVHMTPGQAHVPGGKEAMTLAKLRELSGAAAAERYRKPGQADTALVSLDCGSCHQLDAGAGSPEFNQLKAAVAATGEPTRSVLPSRPAGANFLPVNFEAHCRACHPLRAPDGASAGIAIPGFEVAHRKQGKELTAELNAGYIRGLVARNPPPLAQPMGPGGKVEPLPVPEAVARNLRDEADRLTAHAESVLTTGGGCAKCHDTPGGKVAPVPDRTVWFRSARFDHASHRATSCATCHPGAAAAFAPAGTALVEKEPVQILGIDSCRACHSPAGTKVKLPDGKTLTGGGIRHACTDCHSYHNGDHGLQGRGAAVWQPKQPLDLAGFLRGGKE